MLLACGSGDARQPEPQETELGHGWDGDRPRLMTEQNLFVAQMLLRDGALYVQELKQNAVNWPMCNLYSQTKGQAAIVSLTRAMRDTTGNLPPLPGIFPDYLAPVVRNAPDGVRELAMCRWGLPGPPQFGGAPITNIRNVRSQHWRAWLKPENRCVVPWTSFCEYADTKPKKRPTWFALDESRPLAVFAGIWTTWHGKRGTKTNPIEGEHQLFGFLTTGANDVVAPIHPKAMPVILTSDREIERWMTAPPEEALQQQRPLPDGMLKVVATGGKEDWDAEGVQHQLAELKEAIGQRELDL